MNFQLEFDLRILNKSRLTQTILKRDLNARSY